MSEEEIEYKSFSRVFSIALISYMVSFFYRYQAAVTNLSFNTLKYAYGIVNDPNVELY